MHGSILILVHRIEWLRLLSHVTLGYYMGLGVHILVGSSLVLGHDLALLNLPKIENELT
jgi:hypothetical protein